MNGREEALLRPDSVVVEMLADIVRSRLPEAYHEDVRENIRLGVAEVLNDERAAEELITEIRGVLQSWALEHKGRVVTAATKIVREKIGSDECEAKWQPAR